MSKNNSGPQRKRGRGAGGAGGAGRDPAAAGQEGAALGRARPGAQRGKEQPLQHRARRPGPRPRRPPKPREKRGRHSGGGGSRFAPAGGRRLSGGRTPLPSPGGDVAISAEKNGARGAKVLKEKKEKKIGSRRLLGRLSACLLAGLRLPRSERRHGSWPPSLTPPSPREAAAVASGAEDRLRPQPERRHNN